MPQNSQDFATSQGIGHLVVWSYTEQYFGYNTASFMSDQIAGDNAQYHSPVLLLVVKILINSWQFFSSQSWTGGDTGAGLGEGTVEVTWQSEPTAELGFLAGLLSTVLHFGNILLGRLWPVGWIHLCTYTVGLIWTGSMYGTTWAVDEKPVEHPVLLY